MQQADHFRVQNTSKAKAEPEKHAAIIRAHHHPLLLLMTIIYSA